jgi:hypothetical protein
MISRPLNLAEKLSPPRRSFDALFYVNAGLLVLFFMFFGAPFLRYPGIALAEFSGATQGAQPADVVIAVRTLRSVDKITGVETVANMVLVEGAVLSDLEHLKRWLVGRAAGRSGLRLLVQADETLPASDLFKINECAQAAGFTVQVAAEPMAGSQ